ncbi:glycosyltransferase family 2 protein [Spirosoma foliorum]|uniref:glycosyltransferase family 2 protein n=1 Tax=Spirosoma foliorum TaxID=2710596 RepID=UPI001F0B3327|nr:glycosyltransferase [Spirosoma foliorum]
MANDLSYPPLNSCQTQLLPWVTVICICHNHQDYVLQALKSVIEQDYPTIELIVIDNASTDLSSTRIGEFVQLFPTIRFIRNAVNVGLNRAFNQGLALAQGQYIIDLSADDLLLPHRISRQVNVLEQLPATYGVVFSNAAYIDAGGKKTGVHYPVDSNGHTLVDVPIGFVFMHLLKAYFICTPTMMMRRNMLIELGGYDETLSYEDFDLWVRSARTYQYAYIDAVLTLKRLLPTALSTQVIQPYNHLLPSTLIVCQKAFTLCATPDEFQALAARIQTFVRKAFYAQQFELVAQFGKLLQQITQPDLLTRLILLLSRFHFPVNLFYRIYHQWQPVRGWRNRAG